MLINIIIIAAAISFVGYIRLIMPWMQPIANLSSFHKTNPLITFSFLISSNATELVSTSSYSYFSQLFEISRAPE